MLGAALAGCSAWAAVAIVSEWLLPVPKQLLEELRKTVVPLDGSRGFAATLLLVAVSPAICEETLFRGPILRGLRTRVACRGRRGHHRCALRAFPPRRVSHSSRPPSSAILLGFIALDSGSILPSMLAHLCNNAILDRPGAAGLDERMESLSHRALTLLVGASLAGTVAGFVLLRKARRKSEM